MNTTKYYSADAQGGGGTEYERDFERHLEALDKKLRYARDIAEIKREIASQLAALQEENRKLSDALQNLHDAVPKQTDDADWWQDDLTDAMTEAKKLLTK